MAGLFELVTGVLAGVVDLERRGRLRAVGEDRVRFLDGMVSNAVEGLAAGESRPALLLDRKGRLLSELSVAETGDAFVIETSAGTGDAVREALERYVVADDVTFEDLSAEWSELAIEGPGAGAALGERGAEMVHLEEGALGAEGLRLLGPRGALRALRAELGLPELSAEQCEALRVESLRPTYGVDVDERTFPAEGPFAAAVSFTKGCYVGQEIVARIDSRGAVNRLLVKLGAASPVAVGAAIRAEGADLGRVTSAVASPASGPLALGWIKQSHAEAGARVEIDGVAATVLQLPDAPQSAIRR